MRFLLVLWVLFILYGSFIPFRFTADTGTLRENLAHVRWSLFKDGRRAFSIPDVVSNVLLFVPLGVLAVGARGTSGPSVAPTVVGAVALAAVLAAGIEVGQLFAPGRVSSISDLIANTTGALLGAGAAARVLRPIEGRLGVWGQRLVRQTPEVLPLVVLVADQLASSFYPFQATLDVGTVWTTLKHAQRVPFASLATASWTDQLVEQVLPFALMALLVFRALGRRRSTAPRRSAWLLVASLAVALEVGKLVVVGRRPNVDNALLGGLGALVGVTVLPAFVGSRPVRARPAAWLLALALLFLVHTELTPYDWRMTPAWVAAKIRGIEWLPLAAYFRARPERALFDLWEKLVRSGFLGFAAASVAGRAGIVPWVVGAATGTLLEAAQLVTATRMPSVTDVLTITLGAHAGGAAWQWFGRWRAAPAGERRLPVPPTVRHH
jgi:VanZ family protein